MAEEIKKVTTTEVATPSKVIKATAHVTPGVKLEHPQKVFEKKKTIFRLHQVIWYILVFIEILLMFRVMFRLIAASSFSGFVNMIYAITDVLVMPFQGIVKSTVSGISVFEWSTVIAGVVYAIIAWGIVSLLHFMKPVTPHEVESHVD